MRAVDLTLATVLINPEIHNLDDLAVLALSWGYEAGFAYDYEYNVERNAPHVTAVTITGPEALDFTVRYEACWDGS
jgi:hypothetical protein